MEDSDGDQEEDHILPRDGDESVCAASGTGLCGPLQIIYGYGIENTNLPSKDRENLLHHFSLLNPKVRNPGEIIDLADPFLEKWSDYTQSLCDLIAAVFNTDVRLMLSKSAPTSWDKVCGTTRVIDEVLMEYGVVSVLNGTSLYNARIIAKPPLVVKSRGVCRY